MLKIDDNFCGYLNIGDDKFAFNISQSLVTLLPAESHEGKIQEVLSRIRSRNTDDSEFIFGYDGNRTIALERNTKFNMDFLQLSPIIKFRTPIIIKATGNTDYFINQLTADWDHFHAITFWGGNINAVFPPAIARKPTSPERQTNVEGTIAIELHPSSYYTRSTEIEIDGTKATLTVSLFQTEGTNEEHMNAYNIGELNASIRLSFKEGQHFDKIERYYQIVHSLIAILTAQNNIVFDVYLSQKRQDGLFYRTGICKIFDGFQNYSVRKSHTVIPLLSVFDHIQNLIKMISAGQAAPLLTILPNDNLGVHRISISNIQDLCTALEVAYKWDKRPREKDLLISKLKQNIKSTISDFVDLHPEIEPYNSTTISSAFQYLDYTLSQKILTLYEENHKLIDEFVSRKSLPEINTDAIKAFVKLRNSKTHSGLIEWGKNANLYGALFALLYTCFLKHIELSEKKILPVLLQIF